MNINNALMSLSLSLPPSLPLTPPHHIHVPTLPRTTKTDLRTIAHRVSAKGTMSQNLVSEKGPTWLRYSPFSQTGKLTPNLLTIGDELGYSFLTMGRLFKDLGSPSRFVKRAVQTWRHIDCTDDRFYDFKLCEVTVQCLVGTWLCWLPKSFRTEVACASVIQY